MRVRVVGTDLPGRRFDEQGRPAGLHYDDVQVGVQRDGDVEQLVPATAAQAVFDFELRPKGDQDALGAYAHGRAGERFLYLVWVHGPDHKMFRRAKLMLADIPAEVWAAAVAGATLEATLGLTDDRGGPRCARVRPPVITWRAT